MDESNKIDSQELHELVGQIPEQDYPMSGEDLAERAETMGASETSIAFFESLEDMEVESRDELESVVEQVSDPELAVEMNYEEDSL